MAKIFVTGASGFVGTALVEHLLAQGHEVTGMSRTPTALAHPAYTHLRSDLAHWAEEAEHLPQDFDSLIHLAWAGSGGPARADVALQLKNVELTEAAVLLAQAVGARRFVGVGTITEDELAHAEFSPGVTPGPGFIYGLAKATAANVSRYVAAQAGLEHVWVKLGNTYGLKDPTQRFLSVTLRKMLHDEPLSFTAGTQAYDFVYLPDAVRGFEAVLLRGVPGRTYYLGSGQPRPLRAFLEDLAAITRTRSRLQFGGEATAGVSLPLEAFSIAQLTADTGFVPSAEFKYGVLMLMDELSEDSAG